VAIARSRLHRHE